MRGRGTLPSHGAARIRDVLFDHAIHGIPETVVTGKETRIERRRFNHRTMIWAFQHHMPDQYPGGSTLRRQRDPVAEGYVLMKPEVIAAARATIEQRIRALKQQQVRVAADADAGGDADGSGQAEARAGHRSA